MDKNYNEELEHISYLEQKYSQLLKHIDTYKAKANYADIAFKNCQTSASYRLGHLLIHETKSFKDILKLFSRIKAIKQQSNYSKNSMQTQINIQKPIAAEENENVQNNIDQTKQKYKNGISIVLPTYKGEKTILRVLKSLKKQDLEYKLFEIIVVINGEKDNTENIIKNFMIENPELNIRSIYSDKNGASLARNIGIKNVLHQYIVLIDDDDSVSSNYLSSMYKLASQNTIVFSQIINIDGDEIDSSNLINKEILKTKSIIKNPFSECQAILTINACKLVPSKFMKNIKFNTELKSGEDIVYFSELLSKYSFQYKTAKEAIYFRFINYGSVSRQPLSFEFNIIDRLIVISGILHALNNTQDVHVQTYLYKLILSQINFMNVFLFEYPSQFDNVMKEIEKQEIHNFPYEKLHGNNNT